MVKHQMFGKISKGSRKIPHTCCSMKKMKIYPESNLGWYERRLYTHKHDTNRKLAILNIKIRLYDLLDCLNHVVKQNTYHSLYDRNPD